MAAIAVSSRAGPINIAALGVAASVTLIVLYVTCAIAALALPGLPLAHGWLALFSTAPIGSVRALVEGVIGSVVFGWLIAVVLGYTYNRLA